MLLLDVEHILRRAYGLSQKQLGLNILSLNNGHLHQLDMGLHDLGGVLHLLDLLS